MPARKAKAPALYRYQRRVESTPPHAGYSLTIAGAKLLARWKAERALRLGAR